MKIKRTTLLGMLLALVLVVGVTAGALALSANATTQADNEESKKIATNPVYNLCLVIDTELKDGYEDYDVYANNNVIFFDTQEEMDKHLEVLVKRVDDGISGYALYEGFEDMYANIDLDAPMIGYIPRDGKVVDSSSAEAPRGTRPTVYFLGK